MARCTVAAATTSLALLAQRVAAIDSVVQVPDARAVAGRAVNALRNG